MTGGEEEFEVRLGEAFGQSGGGPGPEVTARLVDGGLEVGRRRKRARRRVALLASALTAVAVVTAGALSVPHGIPGQRTDALLVADSPPPPPPPLTSDVTILLVGLDSTVDGQGRPAPAELVHGDLHAGLPDRDTADTVMLVRIPAGGGEVRQLSLPRDLLATDLQNQKVPLNSVFSTAVAAERKRLSGQGLSAEELNRRAREAGRGALYRAVEHLTGVRVDHYMELSMIGFYRAAQALGGVPVCLNHAVEDSWSGIDLPAGRQELNPAQALAFVRQRHGVGDGSDLGRTVRAQAFLAGVVAKLRDGGALADPAKLKALYDALADELVTDQGWSPADFARQVPALASGRGTASTLPTTYEGNRLRAVPDAARQILDGTGPSSSPAVSSAPQSSAPVRLGGVPCVD
ncbi:LCP family protein [Kitasatospora sp. CB01950]|uniref:LCP family protein n=1 Tax=Kitasatospora sp. CB01950 TaxID=1703930 RepID=UPI00093B965A|nr:LCP family protein [Kitasatospora sp. CB01950]